MWSMLKRPRLLLGTIDSYKLKPVSFTASDVVQEYRLYVTISLFMVRTSDDKVLWQEVRYYRL